MGIRSVFTTLMGLGVAAGSVFMAQSYMTPKETASLAVASPEVQEVIVARSDIAFGTQITKELIATQAWPADVVPRDVFLTYDEVLGDSRQEPRRAKRALVQGELLLKSKVSGFGEKVTIVQALEPNTRAMAIKVNAATGVGGFVTPGDRVDILLTQGGGDTMKAIIVLQNIRVVGVDQASNEDRDKPGVARTVTVQVTPEQSQKLAVAQSAGRLNLMLRTLDAENHEMPKVVELRDIVSPRSNEANTEEPGRVRVRRANAVEDVAITN